MSCSSSTSPKPRTKVLFRPDVDVLPTDLAIVGLDNLHHFTKRQTVFDQVERFDNDLELPLLTAPAHHIVDTIGRTQNQSHSPVVQRAKIHVGDGVLKLCVSAFQCVPEHLAQAGGIGAHFRRSVALWNSIFHLL